MNFKCLIPYKRSCAISIIFYLCLELLLNFEAMKNLTSSRCLAMCFSCNSLLCWTLTIIILLIISSIVIIGLSLASMIYLLKSLDMLLYERSHFDYGNVLFTSPNSLQSSIHIHRCTLSLIHQGLLDTLVSDKQR